MDFWDYLPYVEVYFAKLAVETGLAALFLAALKNYFSSQPETRGFINGHMAYYAGPLGIKCPKCKERDIWDAISEENATAEIKVEKNHKKIETV
jgi:phage FluMu protein Com